MLVITIKGELSPPTLPRINILFSFERKQTEQAGWRGHVMRNQHMFPPLPPPLLLKKFQNTKTKHMKKTKKAILNAQQVFIINFNYYNIDVLIFFTIHDLRNR